MLWHDKVLLPMAILNAILHVRKADNKPTADWRNQSVPPSMQRVFQPSFGRSGERQGDERQELKIIIAGCAGTKLLSH